MNCDELLRRLAEYRDGVLDQEICQAIRRHFDECDPCAEVQRDLADLARLCQCGEPPRMPEDLRRRLAARLREGG